MLLHIAQPGVNVKILPRRPCFFVQSWVLADALSFQPNLYDTGATAWRGYDLDRGFPAPDHFPFVPRDRWLNGEQAKRR